MKWYEIMLKILSFFFQHFFPISKILRFEVATPVFTLPNRGMQEPDGTNALLTTGCCKKQRICQSPSADCMEIRRNLPLLTFDEIIWEKGVNDESKLWNHWVELFLRVFFNQLKQTFKQHSTPRIRQPGGILWWTGWTRILFLLLLRTPPYMKHCTWEFPICTLFGFCLLCDMDLHVDLPSSSCVSPEVATIWLSVANSRGVPSAGSLRCSSISWTPKWWFEKPCLAIERLIALAAILAKSS